MGLDHNEKLASGTLGPQLCEYLYISNYCVPWNVTVCVLCHFCFCLSLSIVTVGFSLYFSPIRDMIAAHQNLHLLNADFSL